MSILLITAGTISALFVAINHEQQRLTPIPMPEGCPEDVYWNEAIWSRLEGEEER